MFIRLTSCRHRPKWPNVSRDQLLEDIQMTNEAIKALMVFAMYGILELALYFSATIKPSKQAARATAGRAANPDFTGSED